MKTARSRVFHRVYADLARRQERSVNPIAMTEDPIRAFKYARERISGANMNSAAQRSELSGFGPLADHRQAGSSN